MTTVENLTIPGADPVDGDWIQITHSSGAVERKMHWTTVPQEPESAVPQLVQMRQARLAVHAAGLTAAIAEAIDALPEPERSVAKIEWEFAPTVKRHNGFVEQLAPALGLTDEQIDALFIAAAQF